VGHAPIRAKLSFRLRGVQRAVTDEHHRSRVAVEFPAKHSFPQQIPAPEIDKVVRGQGSATISHTGGGSTIYFEVQKTRSRSIRQAVNSTISGHL
jgi:hypothetical protein